MKAETVYILKRKTEDGNEYIREVSTDAQRLYDRLEYEIKTDKECESRINGSRVCGAVVRQGILIELE